MSDPEAQERVARLTPKEREILLLVAENLSSKEIAARLGIAKTSVDTYCNRARSKLRVKDRYEGARLLAAAARADDALAAEALPPPETAPPAAPTPVAPEADLPQAPRPLEPAGSK